MAERNKSRILVMWSLVGFVALCVAAVLIASRGDLSTLRLNKEQADFWDAFFKGVGGVVGIVGGSVALSKLLDERVKENHTDALIAREPFFKKRHLTRPRIRGPLRKNSARRTSSMRQDRDQDAAVCGAFSGAFEWARC